MTRFIEVQYTPAMLFVALICVVGLIGGFAGLWLVHRAHERRLQDSFKVLSMDITNKSHQSFLELANLQFDKFHQMAKSDLDKRQTSIQEVLVPVKDSLEKMDFKIQEMEKSRARSDESIYQQVRAMLDAQKELRTETSALVTALRAPQARGRWGEIQLKRVVEMAGMLEYCDFSTQSSVTTEDGRLRPDLIVKLPGGKRIVVDAKAPLLAFLDSMEASTPDLKRQKLLEHSRYVRKHVETLGRKAYWDQFNPAPEFVVLFLPGEHFFSAALEQDPSLIEYGVKENVILATPTTLIALLRSVAYGWRQERLAENARVIGDLGRDLYKRIGDLGGHFGKVGKSLEAAVDNYNKAVGTLETRVLVTARKFQELDRGLATTQPAIESLPPVERKPRELEGGTPPKLDQ